MLNNFSNCLQIIEIINFHKIIQSEKEKVEKGFHFSITPILKLFFYNCVSFSLQFKYFRIQSRICITQFEEK